MIIKKIFKVSLDMKAPTAQRNEWEVVEGDNGNIIEITLTDDGEPVDLSGCKVLAVFGLPTGQTVEQDTEDAYVILSDYGIAVTGTPDADDTITITVASGICSASVSGTGISAATVDGDVFLTKFPDDGTYVFKYVTAWQYGDNSVTIGGTDHNEITIALKTGSFSPGKSSSGLMKCEIQVYSGAQQDVLITSAQFTFRCRRAIINDQTIEATNDYPVLVELIHEVQQLRIVNQSDWDEADPTDPAYIRNKPTEMDPTAHAASHAAGGADEITPASIGAAAADAAPNAHAASHAAGGSDEVTPAAIGAATDDHVHGNITNGGALQDTDVSAATGDKLLIADASDGGKAARSDIAFAAGDTKNFLSAEGAFRTPIELAANVVTNLNDASHSDNSAIRFYCFTSSATNNPGYAGFCLYYSHAYPKGVQYAFNLDNAKISRRSRSSNGTWENWTHIT